MAGDERLAAAHKQVRAGIASVTDNYRLSGPVPGAQDKHHPHAPAASAQDKGKPVAYLKKNEAMGLMKVDMYPYFDAWMAPSSSWTVSPLYLHHPEHTEHAEPPERPERTEPAEDEIAWLRAQREELIEALLHCSRMLDPHLPDFDPAKAVGRAKAAIAKLNIGKGSR